MMEKYLGMDQGSYSTLYLQAIRTWKDSTEKDEKDSQRAINAEKQSRTAGLRELPMFGMFWPMSIALKSTSILR